MSSRTEDEQQDQQAGEHHRAPGRHTYRQASSTDEDGGQMNEDASIGENVLSEDALFQLQEAQERTRGEQKKRLTQHQEDEPPLPPSRAKETYALKRKDTYCPRCGSILVERHGPYGGFLGCAAYPTCKYTRGRSRGLMKMERRKRGPKL